MVHPARHGIYVFLFRSGMRVHHCSDRIIPPQGRISAHGGQPRLCRSSLSFYRHATRLPLGKGSLGKLLELGSERNLGGYHLDGIPALYTSPPFQKSRTEKPVRTAHRLLPRPANVLVWSELLAGRPTKRALI